MNNEVWVTQPIQREAWDEAPPSKPKMRWRMVAVMAAVVLGCGAAAFLVHLGSTVNRQAEQIEQVGIIQMPDRTSGVAGAGTTPEPDPVPGGTGGGTQTTTKTPSSSEEPTSETSSTEQSSQTTSSSESTSSGNTPTTTGAVTTSKPANAPPKPPPSTPKTTSCVLLIFCSVS